MELIVAPGGSSSELGETHTELIQPATDGSAQNVVPQAEVTTAPRRCWFLLSEESLETSV